MICISQSKKSDVMPTSIVNERSKTKYHVRNILAY